MHLAWIVKFNVAAIHQLIRTGADRRLKRRKGPSHESKRICHDRHGRDRCRGNIIEYRKRPAGVAIKFQGA